MSSLAPIHQSTIAGNNRHVNPARHIPGLQLPNLTSKKLVDFTGLSLRSKQINLDLRSNRHVIACVGGSSGVGHGSGGGGNGGGDWSSGGGKSDDSASSDNFGPIGAFFNGWRSRVAADPQFLFKVLMEEIVGVRPNFGLNELDFVFSTLVVGSIFEYCDTGYFAEILAILLQTSIANQKRLGQMNGVDVVLQAVAMYKSRDPKSLDEKEMVENLFDCLCCLLMPLENKEKFLKAEGVELMIMIMNLKKLCYGSSIRAPTDFAMTNYPPACELIWGWIWRKDGYTLHT